MPYSTGNSAQPDLATVTLSVPVIHDGEANDYLMDCLTSFLNQMASPFNWNADNYTQTADDAAAYGQVILDSMSIVWP